MTATSHRGDAGRRRVRRVVFMPAWPDNPYQELLASGLRSLGIDVRAVARMLIFLPAVCRGGRPDVLHLHALDHLVVYRCCRPAALVALALVAAQIAVLRLLGTRITWTVHELMNHERRYPTIDRWCRQLSVRVSDAVITHCEAARLETARVLGIPGDDIHVVPHGHYGDAYPPAPDAHAEARAALGLPVPGPLVLFFGNIRRHKGLEALITAWARLDRPAAHLVVAGQPFDAHMRAAVAVMADEHPKVIWRLGVVHDDQVPTLLAAADVVVCPFVTSLTSGSLALALSYGRAVVAPRLGCATEMVSEGGGFLYDAHAPDGLLRALQAAVDSGTERLDALGRTGRTRMLANDWPGIARRTLEVYTDSVTG